MSRRARALATVAAIGVLGLPATSAAWAVAGEVAGEVDGEVDVAALVVTDLVVPGGVVPGNTVQTVTVTVRNDLPRPLTAVQVSLDGLDTGGPQTVAIPAASSRTVVFRVVPCRAGTSTLTASAAARDGTATVSDRSDPVTLRVAAGSTCGTTMSTPAGELIVSSSAGTMVDLVSVPLDELPSPPVDMVMPYGAMSFTIVDLTPGASATITIVAAGPATGYVKLVDGAWVRVPGAVAAGNTVTFTLTDGGFGDADASVNGRIADPGAVLGTPAPSPSTTTPPGATTTLVASSPAAGAPSPDAESPSAGGSSPSASPAGSDRGWLTAVLIGLALIAGATVVVVARRIIRTSRKEHS